MQLSPPILRISCGEPPPAPISLIKQHMTRIHIYARRSSCHLKVAYIFVDPLFREIARGINGFRVDGRGFTVSARSLEACVPHAEEALKRMVTELGVKSEGYAIGNFSPCIDCVPILKGLGAKGIIFENLFWDTSAIALAHELAMDLWYFHHEQLFHLQPAVIKHLTKLRIAPIANSTSKLQETTFRSFADRRHVESYVTTHRKELQLLLNTLLIELLIGHSHMQQTTLTQSVQTKILRLLSQIDTEQECLRLAQRNIILRKQPW